MLSTETCARKKPVSSRENRVGDFFSISFSCAGQNHPQALEPHQAFSTTSTTTVSGVVYWLSKDPIGISGGLNLYAFCGNNPVNFMDPYGFAFLTVYGNSRGDSNARIVSARASSSGYSPGHVWVEFSYNDMAGNPQIVNRGNYPRDERGGYQDDSGRNEIADFSQTFYVPDDRVEQVLRELYTYDTFSSLWHNCVDDLEEVLDKAGIQHPGFGWPSDPRNVEDWINQQKKDDSCP